MLDDGAIVFTDALGRRIDPRTATGRWAGDRLDLGLAVAGLCALVGGDTGEGRSP